MPTMPAPSTTTCCPSLACVMLSCSHRCCFQPAAYRHEGHEDRHRGMPGRHHAGHPLPAPAGRHRQPGHLGSRRHSGALRHCGRGFGPACGAGSGPGAAGTLCGGRPLAGPSGCPAHHHQLRLSRWLAGRIAGSGGCARDHLQPAAMRPAVVTRHRHLRRCLVAGRVAAAGGCAGGHTRARPSAGL
ncbi:hypothetical protein D9M69_563690 [compost metagenome]